MEWGPPPQRLLDHFSSASEWSHVRLMDDLDCLEFWRKAGYVEKTNGWQGVNGQGSCRPGVYALAKGAAAAAWFDSLRKDAPPALDLIEHLLDLLGSGKCCG